MKISKCSASLASHQVWTAWSELRHCYLPPNIPRVTVIIEHLKVSPTSKCYMNCDLPSDNPTFSKDFQNPHCGFISELFANNGLRALQGTLITNVRCARERSAQFKLTQHSPRTDRNLVPVSGKQLPFLPRHPSSPRVL